MAINLADVLAGSAALPTDCDAFVVLWELRDLASDGPAIVDSIARVATTLGAAKAPLFFGLLPMPADLPLYDAQNPEGTLALVHRTNLALLKLAAGRPHIHAFTWQISTRDAVLTRLLGPLVRTSAKLLVLDADGVLWDGVVGEVGAERIAFHHQLIAYVEELARAGFLVAIVSKNEEADVLAAFHAHAPAALAHFAARRVDWQPKHEHVRALAAEFNIGLDSIVFVDDQPFEREAMRHHLPEVQTLDVLADDEHSLVALLRASGAFDRLRVTEDDRLRASDYAQRGSRAELARAAGDSAAFLHALDLRVTLRGATEEDVPRVVDLVNKTNQFNLTTRRHTEVAVRALLADPRAFVLLCAVTDRFGDQGKVGVIIGAPLADGAVEIDTFLLSCRVIGRGIEDAMWAAALRRIVKHGYTRVEAAFVKSARNDQVARLYERFGFTQSSSDDSGARYTLALPAEFATPSWIAADER